MEKYYLANSFSRRGFKENGNSLGRSRPKWREGWCRPEHHPTIKRCSFLEEQVDEKERINLKNRHDKYTIGLV